MTWRAYPVAPFSPRADMSVYVNQTSTYTAILHFIGGQTAQYCGLREFGVCSNELWTAEVEYSSVTKEVQLVWNTEAVQLPFVGRCGSTLVGPDPMGDQGWSAPVKTDLIGVVGGQLSYNDTSCVAPPMSLSETWYVARLAVNDSAMWSRGPDAPFSPRRSQQHDPAYIQARVATAPGNWYVPSATLIGGMRIVSHRVTDSPSSHSSPIAVLTGVELYADVWECKFPKRHREPSSSSFCMWGEASYPADSVPLPTAGGSPVWSSRGIGGMQIGGVTSLAAIAAYRDTLPRLELEGVGRGRGSGTQLATVDRSRILANLSLIISPRLAGRASSMDELMAARRQLPLSVLLDEAELNGESPYRLGSDWMQSRWQYDSQSTWGWNFPYATTVHHQPLAFANTPEQSTIWVRQAASSLNTTRPHFNFPMRRLGHGSHLYSMYGWYGQVVISGGRTGELYYNDWIELGSQKCFSVTDPSYRAVLGPVEWEDTFDPLRQGVRRQARCADGYHWEPPTRDFRRTTTLTCAPNGVWLSYELLTVQTCRPDALNCSYPYVDLGFEECQLPNAEITRIELETPLHNVDNITIIDAPVTGGQPLTIYGKYFSEPLTVLVGGQECTTVELWLTAADSGMEEVCDDAADVRDELCERFAEQVRWCDAGCARREHGSGCAEWLPPAAG